MLKLYGSPRNRAGRVIWMLEEIGAEYEIIPASPHSEEILKVNPAGKVPALVDGDVAIADSTAIILYLADKAGQLTYPVGTPERARLMSLVCFAIDSLEQPLWTFAKHSFVLPEEVRLGDAIRPACEEEWRRALAALDQMIGDGPFAMGADFTIADIIIGHLGGWAKGAGFPEPEGRLADYMARVRSRPGWKAVLKKREAA